MGAEKDPDFDWSCQDVFSEDGIVLDSRAVLPVQYELTSCLLPISQGEMLPNFMYSIECVIQLTAFTRRLPVLSIFPCDPTDTKLYPLDCSCLSHCSFKDGKHSRYNRGEDILFSCWIDAVIFLFIWCVSLATCRFELPAGPSGSPVQHVTDVTGVQSAGAGPQSAAQLLGQLSAACHFQCYEHQTECAGVAAASSVAIGSNVLEQLYCIDFIVTFVLI